MKKLALCLFAALVFTPQCPAGIEYTLDNTTVVKPSFWTLNATAARTGLGLGPLATITPTGTASNTTYLRGDGTWATVNSSGDVTSVNGQTGAVTGAQAVAGANIAPINVQGWLNLTQRDGAITATSGGVELVANNGLRWNPSTQVGAFSGQSTDTGIFRSAPGTLAIGNGTAGDTSGTVLAHALGQPSGGFSGFRFNAQSGGDVTLYNYGTPGGTITAQNFVGTAHDPGAYDLAVANDLIGQYNNQYAQCESTGDGTYYFQLAGNWVSLLDFSRIAIVQGVATNNPDDAILQACVDAGVSNAIIRIDGPGGLAPTQDVLVGGGPYVVVCSTDVDGSGSADGAYISPSYNGLAAFDFFTTGGNIYIRGESAGNPTVLCPIHSSAHVIAAAIYSYCSIGAGVNELDGTSQTVSFDGDHTLTFSAGGNDGLAGATPPNADGPFFLIDQNPAYLASSLVLMLQASGNEVDTN